MDYSSFELSRKTPKDSFLQKFLVKDFEVKEKQVRKKNKDKNMTKKEQIYLPASCYSPALRFLVAWYRILDSASDRSKHLLCPHVLQNA